MSPWRKRAAAGAGTLAILASIAGWYEGTRHTVYTDGVGVLTACQGVTMASGIPQQFGIHLKPGQTLTPEQCKVLDGAAQKQAIAAVDSLVIVPLDPAERAAFADFVYNVGPQAFARSTLLHELNAGHYAAACAQLNRWVYAGGHIEAGLVKRRASEYRLCMSGVKGTP